MSESFSYVPSIEIKLNEQGPPGVQGEQGIQGVPGPGITNIEKISSTGLVDTYRIHYGEEADPQYLDFNVTNGAGITRIELTSSEGLDDEYTIYYGPMDGSSPQEEFKFIVHNGGSGGGGEGKSYVEGFAISLEDDIVSVIPNDINISQLEDDTNINPVSKASSLEGLEASTTELNNLIGSTSNIQSQLDGKQNAITLDSKLLSDYVDDTNQSNKFMTTTQASNLELALSDIDSIKEKIPNQASSTNQLADKDFVIDGIQSGTAAFDGNWASYSAIPSTVEGFTTINLVAPENGNYLVVLDDETHNNECWRYKYTADTEADYNKNNWHAEYRINETPFTLAEMEAIQSGATASIINSVQGKEDKSNKVTSISANSTDNEYPSAKCVWDKIGAIEAVLRSI